MSAEAVGMPDAAATPTPVVPAVVEQHYGLWSDRTFRVLTILNSSIVAISAVVGLLFLVLPESGGIANLFLAFPVVPATFIMPPVSLVIVLAAAALSCLNMIATPQKGVRFLRAFTWWGTIVLTVPAVFTVLIGGTVWLSSLTGGAP